MKKELYYLNFISRLDAGFGLAGEKIKKENGTFFSFVNKFGNLEEIEVDEKRLDTMPPMVSYFISDSFHSIIDDINYPNFNISFSATTMDRINMNFISIDIEKEKITFIPRKKIDDVLKKYGIEFIKENKGEISKLFFSDEIYKKYSVAMTIGRFIKNMTAYHSIEEKYIEEASNAITAQIRKIKTIKDKMRIVSGEDIRKYYLEENYVSENNGTLGNSCMRYDHCQEYMDIYVENCEMLIIKEDNEKDKISARAILWTDQNGKKYVDRIYGSDINIFLILDYLKSQGYINLRNKKYLPDDDSYIHNHVFIKIKKAYNSYPYMDSMVNEVIDKKGNVFLTNLRHDQLRSSYLDEFEIRRDDDLRSTRGNIITICPFCLSQVEEDNFYFSERTHTMLCRNCNGTDLANPNN